MRICFYLGLACVVAMSSAAYAQIDDPARSHIETETQVNLPRFSITPRAQLLLTNPNVRVSTSAPSNTVQTLTVAPFYGATFGYAPPGSEFDALLTVLNSDGYSRNSTISVKGPLVPGSTKGSRIDVELLGRRRLSSGENTFLLLGARYLHLSFDTHLQNNSVFPNTGKSNSTDAFNSGFLEVGLGTGGALNQSHTLAYFSNLLIGPGYVHESNTGNKSRNDIGYLVDVSAGLSYRVSDSVGLAFRYRATIAGTPQLLFVAHGPELSTTFSW